MYGKFGRDTNINFHNCSYSSRAFRAVFRGMVEREIVIREKVGFKPVPLQCPAGYTRQQGPQSRRKSSDRTHLTVDRLNNCNRTDEQMTSVTEHT